MQQKCKWFTWFTQQSSQLSWKMNITSIFVKTRELTNSLAFTKMLVIFIFWQRGIRNFLSIHILVFYFSSYYNEYFPRFVCKIYFTFYICILYIYLFFYLLQCQWLRHGSEVLENTLLILRGREIPPSSIGFASGHQGGYCQPLRIWRVFSNTSSPCLGHCHIVIR